MQDGGASAAGLAIASRPRPAGESSAAFARTNND